MRGREFLMKDNYSFDLNEKEAKNHMIKCLKHILKHLLEWD